MTTYTVNDLKRGLKLCCNGYPASVYKVCDGRLTGMVEVMVPGGITCVSASELIRFQNHISDDGQRWQNLSPANGLPITR